MDEKILIKSEGYNVKKLFLIILTIGIALSALISLVIYSENASYYDRVYNDYYTTYTEHQEEGSCGYSYSYYGGYYEVDECWECEWIRDYPSKSAYALEDVIDQPIFLIPIAFFALVGGILYLWLRSFELTVTDRRIYGVVAWGKRVDLPVDSVSATATIRFTKGVTVSTASGRISFRMLKNADAIYSIINKLLIERQQNKQKVVYTPAAQPAPQSNTADELKKYNELLDAGIISQEEFDAKKKQLLGL